MSTYAGIGYIDNTSEYDDVYIRHDTMAFKGELITHDNSTGLSQALPPGVDGSLLVARPANSFGLAWEPLLSSAITVTGSTFLTVTGSPVALGGTVTLTNTALNDYFNTGCWGAGNLISFGGSSTYTVLVGNSCSSAANTDWSIAMGTQARVGGDQCISIGHLAGSFVSSGPQNIYIGTSTGSVCTSVTGRNVFVGHNAGLSQTNCDNAVIIGANAGVTGSIVSALAVCIGSGTKTQPQAVIIGANASADQSETVTIGYSAVTTGTQATAIGTSASAAGATSIAIGLSASAGFVDNIAIGPSAITRASSSIAIGRAADAATDCVCVGRSATSVGLRAVAIGPQASTPGDESVAIGYQAKAQTSTVSIGLTTGNTTSTDSVFIGNSAGQAVTANNNVIIGSLAGGALTTGIANVFVGGTSGNVTAAATMSAGFGYNARCNGSESLALGANSYANGTNVIAIGEGVTNTVANSALIGDSTAFIVKSAGFLQSSAWYSCKAGRVVGTQTITFPGPVTLTITFTDWTSGCAVSGNNITMPLANTQFSINACVRTSAVTGPAVGNINMRLRYYNGATTSTIAEQSFSTNALIGNIIAWCFSSTVQTPGTTAAYVYAEIERIGGGTTSIDVSNYSLTVKRDA